MNGWAATSDNGTFRPQEDIRPETASGPKADIDQVAITIRDFMSTRPSLVYAAISLRICRSRSDDDLPPSMTAMTWRPSNASPPPKGLGPPGDRYGSITLCTICEAPLREVPVAIVGLIPFAERYEGSLARSTRPRPHTTGTDSADGNRQIIARSQIGWSE